MKRYLFFLLWLMASLSGFAYVGETFEIDGITYLVDWEDLYDEFTTKYYNDCTIVSSSANLSGSITIPAAVEHNGRHYKVHGIEEEAFKNRTNITALYTPSGYEFYDSEFQRTVVVEGLRGIGPRAFENCTGLTYMDLGGTILEAECLSISSEAFKGCSNIKTIVISSNRFMVDKSYFEDCSNSLNTLTVTVEDVSIGECAFKDFTNLYSIDLMGVNSIHWSAFSGCKQLRFVSLSEKLKTIGSGAFSGCVNLESFFIPSSVTEIGEGAFDMFIDDSSNIFPQLREFVVDPENRHYTSIDGVLFNKSVTKLMAYPIASSFTDYTLPITVDTIPAASFAGSTILQSVTIPGNVEKINSSTFRKCENLITVNLPESLQELGWRAFEDCKSLSSITLPQSLQKIDSECFMGCSNLHSITIPDDVTCIKENTFNGCLTLKSIKLPAKLEKIEPRACRYAGLESLDIPEGTKLLGTNAFVWNEKLKQITLPASLEPYNFTPSYGDPQYNYQVFNNGLYGNKIEDIYYKAEDPVELNEFFFANPVYEYATLHVPAVAVEKAAVTLPWSKFQKIVAHDFSTEIQDVIVDQTVPTEVYNLSGVKVSDNTESLPAGIYIVRQGNEVKKIAIR